MSDTQALQNLWLAMWDVFNAPMDLPVLGMTSPLLMSVYLGVLSMLVYFINRLYGNDGDD